MSVRKATVQVCQAGLTLLETLLALVILALATATLTWSMRPSGAFELEREAVALSARLQAARALAIATGHSIEWSVTADGYQFEGIPVSDSGQEQLQDAILKSHYRWTYSGVQVDARLPLVIPAEPLMAPVSIMLRLDDARVEILSDGWRPFEVRVHG